MPSIKWHYLPLPPLNPHNPTPTPLPPLSSSALVHLTLGMLTQGSPAEAHQHIYSAGRWVWVTTMTMELWFSHWKSDFRFAGGFLPRDLSQSSPPPPLMSSGPPDDCCVFMWLQSLRKKRNTKILRSSSDLCPMKDLLTAITEFLSEDLASLQVQ